MSHHDSSGSSWVTNKANFLCFKQELPKFNHFTWNSGRAFVSVARSYRFFSPPSFLWFVRSGWIPATRPPFSAGVTMPKKVAARPAIRLRFSFIFYLTFGHIWFAWFSFPTLLRPVIRRFEVAHAHTRVCVDAAVGAWVGALS